MADSLDPLASTENTFGQSLSEQVIPSILLSLDPTIVGRDDKHFIHEHIEKQNTKPPIPADHKLTSAFDVFNELSLQLTQSYQLLENRVAKLSLELNDVNEQREEELKQKQQFANRLESLISFLPGGVVVLDQRGVVVESNPAAESMLDKKINGQLWRHIIQRCFAPRDDDGHEVSNHRGQRISIATRSLGSDGQIILLTDQTETRRLQAELSRHERLTALGKMVSTLAHQVRTPLSSAMLYGNHLLNEPLTVNQHQQFTQKLVNRLHEMERQVSDMLLFVKGDIPLTDKVSLDELQQQLQESIEMILHHHDVTCEWNIQHHHEELTCNKDALVGAIVNLINNSLQAMPQGGRITISIMTQDNHQVLISVSDEGEGIEKEALDRITEWFYTTKSQGTGIGLSVVNNVVQSHGGHFRLENNPDHGVSAHLILPIRQTASTSSLLTGEGAAVTPSSNTASTLSKH